MEVKHMARPQLFDIERSSIIVAGERRRLSPLQLDLLQALWDSQRVLDRDDLGIAIYGHRARPTGVHAVLKVTIHRLRKALAGSSYRIDTFYGKGYRLVEKERGHAFAE
jgi:DNA-binding winged helix-turn-helix (wHTH) protein